MKLVRRVSRNMHGLARCMGRFFSPEDRLNLAFENDEGLLKVVPVRRWAATWRDVHIDEAETPGCVVPAQKCRIGVTYQTDVNWNLLIGTRHDEVTGWIIRWQG